METSLYAALAKVYDRLNDSVDYGAWADFITRLFERYAEKPVHSVVDLGCGTGSVTLELAARGYDMTGVDASAEMLAVARSRDPGDKNILWLMQDLVEFELYGTVDAAVCCLDCVNHLTSRADVSRFFHWVHNYLEPGGLFLFDVNSPQKFETTYGQSDYILEDDGVYLGWQNDYNPKTGLAVFSVSLFSEKKDGTWTREDAEQRERAYGERALAGLLKENHLTVLGRFADYACGAVTPESERWYYVCRAEK